MGQSGKVSDEVLRQVQDACAHMETQLQSALAQLDEARKRAIEAEQERDRLRALLVEAGICAHGRESGCCLECSLAGRFCPP